MSDSSIKVKIDPTRPGGVESCLRKFKRLCEAAGVLKEYRKRKEYRKPSVERKEKLESAAKRKSKEASKMRRSSKI